MATHLPVLNRMWKEQGYVENLTPAKAVGEDCFSLFGGFSVSKFRRSVLLKVLALKPPL